MQRLALLHQAERFLDILHARERNAEALGDFATRLSTLNHLLNLVAGIFGDDGALAALATARRGLRSSAGAGAGTRRATATAGPATRTTATTCGANCINEFVSRTESIFRRQS